MFCVRLSDSGLLGAVTAFCGGYGLCQSACNAGWAACYAAGNLVAGTTTGGLGAPVAALACNAIQGTCMASCAASFLFA